MTDSPASPHSPSAPRVAHARRPTPAVRAGQPAGPQAVEPLAATSILDVVALVKSATELINAYDAATGGTAGARSASQRSSLRPRRSLPA